MTTKDRLKQYIEEDKIYNNWVNNNLNELSDFDKFCIQHCSDIKEILEENQELKKQLKIIQDGFTSSINDLCEYAIENERLKKQLSNSHQIKMKRLQQENRKLKQQLSNSHQIKNQQKKFIEYLENEIKYWEEQEQQWIKLGFMKFGGEANNKIIFKKVLSKYKKIVG